jgi:mannonate dehydratase
MGEDRDLDRGESGPYVESFALFARIFEKYPNCYADISAMTQVNRAGPALARVIEADAWHARLLNGSDYPLPGVLPMISVDYLVSLGLLRAEDAPVLKEIRRYNPLLFDFVAKRALRSNGKALSARVFETRGFFMRSSGHVG